MSDLTLQTPGEPTTLHPPGPRRVLAFRLLALAVALVFIVGFGVWRSLLTPWVSFPDSTDHGWPRTSELHLLADSLSAAVMGAVGVAALLLALRPRGRSALVAWLVAILAAVGLSSAGSSFVQDHDPVGPALFAVVWFAVLVAPLALLAPDRRSLLGGGTPAAEGTGPGQPLRVALVGLVVAGAALAVGAVAWRLTGGIFEDPREDDVFGLVLLGVQLTIGGGLCLRAREGWRSLALVLAGTTAYVVVALVSLALR